MSAKQIYLDPTAELERPVRPAVPRPGALAGLTLGLFDIGKPKGDIVLGRLAERFAATGVTIKHYNKGNYSAPAPTALRQRVAEECDLVVEGLAD